MDLLVQKFWGEKNSAEFVFGYFKSSDMTTKLSGGTNNRRTFFAASLKSVEYVSAFLWV